MNAPHDLFPLFLHFLTLSLLAIGGAITTTPEMHRYLVSEHGWLSDAQFTASVAIAQAAPGPNLLFVAVLGWNVAGWQGAAVSMLGILLPSTTLTLSATRWASTRRESRGVRAFSQGLAPIAVGLILATSWLLAKPSMAEPLMVGLMLFTVIALLRDWLAPVTLVAIGAAIGIANSYT